MKAFLPRKKIPEVPKTNLIDPDKLITKDDVLRLCEEERQEKIKRIVNSLSPRQRKKLDEILERRRRSGK